MFIRLYEIAYTTKTFVVRSRPSVEVQLIIIPNEAIKKIVNFILEKIKQKDHTNIFDELQIRFS